MPQISSVAGKPVRTECVIISRVITILDHRIKYKKTAVSRKFQTTKGLQLVMKNIADI